MRDVGAGRCDGNGSSLREALPLLAAVAAAVTIFVGAALAAGPPPQAPFPDPPVLVLPGPRPIGIEPDWQCQDYDIHRWMLPSDQIPYSFGPIGPMREPGVQRPRMYLAHDSAQARRWRYLVDLTGRRLPRIDFRRCALLAIFIPNGAATLIGVRVNNRTTLTAGLWGRSLSDPAPMSNAAPTVPPVAFEPGGWAIIVGVPAKRVRSVTHLYAITRPQPPPPSSGPATTTSSTTTGLVPGAR